jgi:hypothetical protein
VEEKKDEKKFTDRNRKMLIAEPTVQYGSASMYIARLASSVSYKSSSQGLQPAACI